MVGTEASTPKPPVREAVYEIIRQLERESGEAPHAAIANLCKAESISRIDMNQAVYSLIFDVGAVVESGPNVYNTTTEEI